MRLAAGGVPALAVLLAACAQESATDVQAVAAEPAAHADSSGEEAWNMALLGHHDLQGRDAYHAVPHRYGDHSILFVGHHSGEGMNTQSGVVETNGMSVVDITDPTAPIYLHHEPATGEAPNRQHIQVCDGSDLPDGDPAKIYLAATSGGLGAELLDVTDPADPQFISTIYTTELTDTGRRGTHKIFWDCESGIGYLNGTPEGWRITRVLQVWDLGNPDEPGFIRDFALDGSQPGATGPIPTALHAPFAFGDRVYLGYGASDGGIIQILDRDKLINGDPDVEDPFAPTPENLLYPQISRLDMPTYYGAHTVKPIFGVEVADYAETETNRLLDLALVPSEEFHDACEADRDPLFVLDITEPDKPFPISTFQTEEALGDFCTRGLRFGPHSINDEYHPNFDKKLVVMSYFNAGIRVADIRDPFRPAEIAYYIPKMTETTHELCDPNCDIQIQTNNVDIDYRGYIFAVDRAGTGLHILELTGEAREIAGL